ncbi:hypothetical protein DMUE_3219, partial [Dictyocoela muelleri]
NKHELQQMSLFNFLLLTGRVPRGHDMLSLTKEIRRVENDTYKPTRATFTITPPNTNLQIQRTLPLLEDLDKQDIFALREEILETASIAYWDEVTTLQVIKSISSTSILSILRDARTIGDAFSSLFDINIPHTTLSNI